jgi:hypothetical protein
MNPARVFGPAVVAGDWDYHWVWWVSEILGALFSVALEAMVFAPIMISSGNDSSPLWWWRLFMWKNNFSNNHGRKSTVQATWNQAFSGESPDEQSRETAALRKSSPPRQSDAY